MFRVQIWLLLCSKSSLSQHYSLHSNPDPLYLSPHLRQDSYNIYDLVVEENNQSYARSCRLARLCKISYAGEETSSSLAS